MNKADSVTSNIAINTDNISFTGSNNRAIVCTNGSISGVNSNSEILFSSNSVSNRYSEHGGAICADNLQISTGKFTFQNNIGGVNYYGGGAIYCSDTLTFSGADTTATFMGNNSQYGGAIYTKVKLQMSSGSYIFQNNNALQEGGGICSDNTVTFSGANTTATFTGNTSNYGGAINAPTIQFLNGSYYFINNSSSRAGAIFCDGSLTFSGANTTATFTGNSAPGSNGGAIWVPGVALFSMGTYLFQNNSGAWGGAISCGSTLTFSGDNTIATFTGNIASNYGNDLHTYNLTFADRGKYSFDGGIYVKDRGNTSINQAQVTIAGRQFRPDDPTVEDTTNNYGLQNATISNGGTLTANMDYINQLTGTFTLSDAESLITMNKGSDTATIKSSTGRGVATLNFTSDVETISISSGRIDVKGAMSASIELQNDATFSPGNSAGTLDLDGDFIAKAGSKLIFEKEGGVYDQLFANVVEIDPSVQVELLFDTFAPGAVYDIIIAHDMLNVDQSWIDMIQGLLPEDFEALIYNGNTVRLKSTQEPVPEPTTWALLILGVAGLMYMRKRSRQ